MPFITGKIKPSDDTLLLPGCTERHNLPSASAMDRILRCPTSLNIGSRIRVERDKKLQSYADTGSDIHSVLAGEAPIESLAPEHHATVDIISNIEARIQDEYDFHGSVEILREVRIWYAPNGVKQYSGAPDLVMLKPHGHGYRALIINYKTLWGKQVPIAENWQMHTEDLLVRLAFPEVEESVICLIHPRDKIGTHQVKVLTVQDSLNFERNYLQKALDSAPKIDHLTDVRSLPYFPGDIQCKYCPAGTLCPGRKTQPKPKNTK